MAAAYCDLSLGGSLWLERFAWQQDTLASGPTVNVRVENPAFDQRIFVEDFGALVRLMAEDHSRAKVGPVVGREASSHCDIAVIFVLRQKSRVLFLQVGEIG